MSNVPQASNARKDNQPAPIIYNNVFTVFQPMEVLSRQEITEILEGNNPKGYHARLLFARMGDVNISYNVYVFWLTEATYRLIEKDWYTFTLGSRAVIKAEHVYMDITDPDPSWIKELFKI